MGNQSSKNRLSVVLATRNEEENIGRCLVAVKDIADEIIIFDEYSTDKTQEIAKKYGAKVYLEPHHDNFHITKQKAIDKAKGDWILQLDADEVVAPELAKEILQVLEGKYVYKTNKLFERHQKAIEDRDGKIGTDSETVVAYFIPRKNMFLGRPLIHAGVYPDPAIRLIKKGKAYLPAKSVHEIMKIGGKISWLSKDLLHYDSPTLKRYFWRLNRYTDLQAQELEQEKVSKGLLGFLQYIIYKPMYTFLNLYVRHAGFKDGGSGFLWSFFSALHFPIAYFKFLTDNTENEN